MKVLVVGATGQVGSEVVRQLSQRGTPVRALVRVGSAYHHLRDLPGVELAFGDLLRPETLRGALDGVGAVIATANGVAPRRRRDFGRVETVGYPALIAVAERAGVDRFVYLSTVPMGDADARLPMSRHKRAVEDALAASTLPATVMRFGAFADVWLALAGSSIPLAGMSPTLFDRPFRFMRVYRRMTGSTIERSGRMSVVGSPDRRLALITVHDVAAFLIAALEHDTVRDATYEIGGPEALSWREIAALYEDLLGRKVRITTLPPGPFRMLGRLLRPVAPAAANTLALNHAAAVADTEPTGELLAAEFGVGPLQRPEAFLKERYAVMA
jgi:uncharacterized protein YbjT (DUF2867 family)